MKKEAPPPDPSIRILKISTCSTLSGRSELTYHLGCNSNAEVLFRVVTNTGNGQFNADWVALPVIEKLLAGHPVDKVLTSRILQSLFRGKSSNSPAFLFAVLKAEGLVIAGEKKDSGYLLGNLEAFNTTTSELIVAGTSLSLSAIPPESAKKKRPAKPAAS